MVGSVGFEGFKVVEAADRALLLLMDDAATTVDRIQNNDTKKPKRRI